MKRFLSAFTPNEWVVVLLFVSAFTNVFAVVGYLALIPVYFLVTRQTKKALPKNAGEGLLFVFAGLAVLSTFLFARNAMWDAVTESFQLKAWYLKGLSILIVILSFDMTFLLHTLTEKALTSGLRLSVILSYPCFLLALIQKLLGLSASADRPGRVAAVFRNENYYGVAVECLVLFALYLAFREKDLKWRLLCLFAIPVNLAGLWLSQCRTAFLVTAAAALIFLLIRDLKLFGIAAGVCAAGALVLFLVPGLLPRLDSLGENLAFRTGIWKAALRAFLDQPIIGRGYFSYSGIWETYGGEFFALHAHNLYLEVLLNFGILGFLSLFGYAGYESFQSVALWLKAKRKAEAALVVSILAAVLLHGILDTTIFWPQTGIFIVPLLGSGAAFQNAAMIPDHTTDNNE